MILNKGQQTAAEGFLKFLLNDEKEYVLTAPGGHGKTTLVKHLIDVIIPQYQDYMKVIGAKSKFTNIALTAMTHAAANVLAVSSGLSETSTIHFLLKLRVSNNYSTGKTILHITKDTPVLKNQIIFIDEAFMMDSALYKILKEHTQDCKIVYVGDENQLGPVNSSYSPISACGGMKYELTEPMRNKGEPHLIKVCKELEHRVKDREFGDIETNGSSIVWMNPQDAQKAIDQTYKNNEDARVLCFTNLKVKRFNDHIRAVKGFVNPYEVDEELIVNSPFHAMSKAVDSHDRGEVVIPAECRATIKDCSLTSPMAVQTIYGNDGRTYSFSCYHGRILTSRGELLGVCLVKDSVEFSNLMKEAARNKDWKAYYDMKDWIPDLRPKYASTIHKAQGNSFDTVFIDLADLANCRNPDLIRRLLYVAFTRARHRVVLFGQLDQKYGRVIHAN